MAEMAEIQECTDAGRGCQAEAPVIRRGHLEAIMPAKNLSCRAPHHVCSLARILPVARSLLPVAACHASTERSRASRGYPAGIPRWPCTPLILHLTPLSLLLHPPSRITGSPSLPSQTFAACASLPASLWPTARASFRPHASSPDSPPTWHPTSSSFREGSSSSAACWQSWVWRIRPLPPLSSPSFCPCTRGG